MRPGYRFFLSLPGAPAYLAEHRKEFVRECWAGVVADMALSDDFWTRLCARSKRMIGWPRPVHCYRYWYGTAEGDPVLKAFEEQPYRQPKIAAPTIVLQVAADPLYPASFSDGQQGLHTGHYERRAIGDVGHKGVSEAPAAFVEAIKDIARIS